MCFTCLVSLNVHFDSLERNEQFASITSDFNRELSCGLLQLQLILSYDWLEFRWLDKRFSWFYPATESSSGVWMQVAADSILRLTRVSAAEYELRLILSCGWLEFRLLNTSCGWFYPTADSYSSSWIRVADNSILWLTRVLAVANFILQLYQVPVARCELQLIPSYG